MAKSNPSKKKTKTKKAATKKASKADGSANKSSNTDSGTQPEQSLVLESILGIADVEDLYKTLGEYVDKKQDVVIDASDVSSVDTALLQLLLVFIRKMRNEGINVSWHEPSQAFCKTATVVDLATHLGIDEVKDGA
ncbi:MAG: STAS domain-containing protein [Gammaproteobacteria bacterium]